MYTRDKFYINKSSRVFIERNIDFNKDYTLLPKKGNAKSLIVVNDIFDA